MDYISIVIPAYNAENWLARCLDSVLAAADPDCEIIVVDDGSIDSTPDIIKKYTESDPRITSCRSNHVGPLGARKVGFDESTGDILLFVDSDDTLIPTAISTLRRLSEEPSEEDVDEDKAAHWRRRVTDGLPHLVVANTICRSDETAQLIVDGGRRAMTGLEFANDLLTGVLPGIFVGKFFSREILEAIDWHADENIMVHESIFMMLTVAMKLEEWKREGRGDHLILIDPGHNVYNYMLRPFSQINMLSRTNEGMDNMWRALSKLGLPEPQLTVWALEMLRKEYIERGIPFDNTFAMARDVAERAKLHIDAIPDHMRTTVRALTSPSLRLKISRRISCTQPITALAPHISFIIPARDSVSKVKRSVKSIYNLGFRNIEVIIVDANSDYKSSVALNDINIRYPRVRIVRTIPGAGNIIANVTGFEAATGLAVMFVRPGDRVNCEGAHDALIHIDNGADMVIVNISRFSPYTRRFGQTESFADKFGDSYDESIDYNEILREKIDSGDKNFAPRMRANIWRRQKLLDAELPADELDKLPWDELPAATLRHIMRKPLRIIVQNPDAHPSYHIALTTKSLKSHFSPTRREE